MKSIKMTPEQVDAFYSAHPCPECARPRKRVEAMEEVVEWLYGFESNGRLVDVPIAELRRRMEGK